MKKTVILGVSLCLLLSGCAPQRRGEADTSGNGLAVQVAEEKAAYYRQLASELQQELLSARAEFYEKYGEYEAKIADLEKQLSAATAGGSGDNSNADKDADANAGVDKDTDVSTGKYADFQFRMENGGAVLLSYIGSARQVEIPAMVEGVPVTAIGDRAFENCVRLESVTVPDGVATVGWFAFSGCVKLSSVRLPDSVRSISYGAFLNCNSDMIITCSADSYAAAYARSYGIEVRT